MDARVLLASLALSVLSALFCGLAPALQSTRTDLVNGLKAADVDMPGRKRPVGPQRAGRRAGLDVSDAARGVLPDVPGIPEQRAAGTGFAKDHLLMVRFDPRLVQYDAAQTQQFYQLLTERARDARESRARAHPESSARAGQLRRRRLRAGRLRDAARSRELHVAPMDTVDEGFFETMGIAILRGRGFRAVRHRRDAARRGRQRAFREHYWPNADAVGKRIRLENATGTPVEIVGVAQTIKYRDSFDEPIDFVYLPLAQHPVARMVLLLRSSGDPLQLVQPVKDVVRALDPTCRCWRRGPTRTCIGTPPWKGRASRSSWSAPWARWACCSPSPACTGWWRTT